MISTSNSFNTIAAVNISLLIFAVLLVVLGIRLLGSELRTYRLASMKMTIPVSVCGILSAGGTILASSFGFYGVVRKHVAALATNAVLLGLLIAIHVILASNILYATRKLNQMDFDEDLAKTLASDELMVSFDYIQHKFGCCGVQNYKDYTEILNFTSYPRSCCARIEEECLDPTYRQGCSKSLMSFIKLYYTMIGILYLLFIIVCVFVIFLDCVVVKELEAASL